MKYIIEIRIFIKLYHRLLLRTRNITENHNREILYTHFMHNNPFHKLVPDKS